jgi:hypothetical protein
MPLDADNARRISGPLNGLSGFTESKRAAIVEALMECDGQQHAIAAVKRYKDFAMGKRYPTPEQFSGFILAAQGETSQPMGEKSPWCLDCFGSGYKRSVMVTVTGIYQCVAPCRCDRIAPECGRCIFGIRHNPMRLCRCALGMAKWMWDQKLKLHGYAGDQNLPLEDE